MLYRSLIGLVGVAALAIATGIVEASEDMKYPNWNGQWGRFIVRGLPGQPSFDQTKLGTVSTGPAHAGVSEGVGGEHGRPGERRTW